MNEDVHDESNCWRWADLLETVRSLPHEAQELIGPHYEAWLTFQIAKIAIFELQRHIEDPDNPNISWAQPFAEFHWPVLWDWEQDRVQFFGVRPADGKFDGTEEELFQEMTERGWRALELSIFDARTKGAYWKRKDGKLTNFLRREEHDTFTAMTEREQSGFMEAMFRPYTVFGDSAEPTQWNWIVTLDGSSVTLNRMAPIHLLLQADEPNSEGTRPSGKVIVRFHQLVVDEDSHAAYFPVTAELKLSGEMAQADRAEFWPRLGEFFEVDIPRMLDEIPPDVEIPPELENALRENRVIEVPQVTSDQQEFCKYISASSRAKADWFNSTGRLSDLPVPQRGYPKEEEVILARFPSPPDLKWEDVHLLLTPRGMIVQVGKATRRYALGEVGLEDRRGGKPNRLFHMLKILGRQQGAITFDSRLTEDQRRTVKPAIKDLRAVLKAVFGLSGDPFHGYRTARGYSARFKIAIDSDLLAQDSDPTGDE